MKKPLNPVENSTPGAGMDTTAAYVEKFLSNCSNRGLSINTVKWYRLLLARFTAANPVFPKEVEAIEKFIGQVTGSDETRHGNYRAIKTFYSFIYGRFLPKERNPFSLMQAPRRLPKEKQALSLEQLKRLLDYEGHAPLIAAFLHFLADTGARLGEAASIQAPDIGIDTVKIKGKTGERIVPISPKTRELLIEILPKSNSKQQRLFPYSLSYLGRSVVRAMHSAGITGFSAHSLRHSFCTLFEGSDLAMKYITGHSSWSMVEHYSHQKQAKATAQHRLHGPLAQLYGIPETEAPLEPAPVAPPAPEIPDIPAPRPAAAAPPDALIERIVNLSLELGAANEKIRRLEAMIELHGMAVLVRG